MVYQVLRLLYPEVVYRASESTVGTPSYTIEVGQDCGGYQGIGLMVMLLVLYLWLFRHTLRFPAAFLLLPLGVAFIWLANLARLVLLIIIGSSGSPEIANGGFHSEAGWLTFNAIGLGLVAASRHSGFFTRPSAAPPPKQRLNLTAAYLAPLFAIVATAMLTRAFTLGFDQLYPLRVLVAGAVLWRFREAYASLRWTVSWQAVAIGIAVFLLWLGLEPLSMASGAGESLAAGLSEAPGGWAVTWIIFRIVGSVVTVPLAEELAFRGYLTRRLIGEKFEEIPLGRFSWFSFVLSSVLFGALHGRWLAGTLAGMFYAVALYRRKELADAVVAHAVTNALIAVHVLATGAWSLWD
jgi:exosortase E/protease (VPEID-CTERM system)